MPLPVGQLLLQLWHDVGALYVLRGLDLTSHRDAVEHDKHEEPGLCDRNLQPDVFTDGRHQFCGPWARVGDIRCAKSPRDVWLYTSGARGSCLLHFRAFVLEGRLKLQGVQGEVLRRY